MSYATIRDAAIAGLRRAKADSLRDGSEYAGFVRSVGGLYEPSYLITDGDSGSVSLTDFLSDNVPGFDDAYDEHDSEAIRRLVKAAGFVSQFHTHPCVDRDDPTYNARWAKYFSVPDMRAMVFMGFQNVYILVTCTGQVYEANPNLPVLYPDPVGPFADEPAALGKVIAMV